jgi:hypothetical protein
MAANGHQGHAARGTKDMQRAAPRTCSARASVSAHWAHAVRGIDFEESLQVQLLTPPVTAPFQPLAATRPINKNETHRLGSGGKEVDAIVPGSRPAWINQPEVRLVYQGRA